MKAVIASPGPDGAHNWNPMAYSPKTGLVYLAAKSGTQGLHAPDPKWKYDENNVNVGFEVMYDGPLNAKLQTFPPAIGKLLAWDPVAQKEVWSFTYPTVEGGGVLVSGSVVFQGRADGVLAAYSAKDGRELWKFDTGTGIMAAPVTFLVEGVQYIAVMAGWGGAAGMINAPGTGPLKPGFGRIVAFRLDGTAKLNAPFFGHKDPPKAPMTLNSSKEVVHEGELLFGFNCAVCHGVNAVGGSLPDLRYCSKDVLTGMEDIVLRGSRAGFGMPSFRKLLTARQVGAIRAYIVSRAHESATAANVLRKP